MAGNLYFRLSSCLSASGRAVLLPLNSDTEGVYVSNSSTYHYFDKNRLHRNYILVMIGVELEDSSLGIIIYPVCIMQGITTYEYVVAMRVQNEQQGFSAEGDAPSFPTSPSSSTATGLSGSSSIGLQYSRGGWCTPPRVFVDHQV